MFQGSMSRLRLCLIMFVIPVAALAWWIHHRATAAPEVPFATVRRETLVSTLETNGKVEPSSWVVVRATRPGIISRVNATNGEAIAKGAVIAELDSQDARAELASAEAALADAQAQLHVLNEGGNTAARIDIENELARNRAELAAAQREYESLERLVAKQAATKQELFLAAQKVDRVKEAIAGLERKRGGLVTPAERVAAEAKVAEAQATAAQARIRLDRSRIGSPMSGIIYNLTAREGAYVNVGDALANVGVLDTVRVRVYVDEPELGRVSKGMPVTITWDAMPGREWKGEVEQLPTEIVALNTRQVGEVVCTIQNPGHELIPGTNVNAEIVSQVVSGGLTIPKEAIRRLPNDVTGVYVLNGDHLEWRAITIGASSVTRAAVTGGLKEGEMVALTTDKPLANGQRVNPVVR
jgi:HlyD family secretion protein